MRVEGDIANDIRKQQPKDPAELSHGELRRAVRHIQEILWLEVDYNGDYWNKDKPWDPGTIEDVALILINLSLRPELGDGGA